MSFLGRSCFPKVGGGILVGFNVEFQAIFLDLALTCPAECACRSLKSIKNSTPFATYWARSASSNRVRFQANPVRRIWKPHLGQFIASFTEGNSAFTARADQSNPSVAAQVRIRQRVAHITLARRLIIGTKPL